MFSKVLIANRGEIAVRIADTCRQMGIVPVAVYSTADEHALHVRRAAEAYCIGPPAPTESYLCIPRILEACRSSGAEAVHPGYGFLSENGDFARAVQEADLVWIGPSAGVIDLMGDKVAAKRLAAEAGLPLIPGYMGEDQSLDRMLEEAEGVGYPLMVKAAGGGGGKGMRVVHSREDLSQALEGAAREATSAFGDGTLFLEKLLVDPRHVEIQLIADQHGAVVHLGERECSLQRRHQKIIEESPSPVMTPNLRSAMGEDAVRLGRRCKYSSAGTVEFLFIGDRYYFLEMNTRIQVEHPVTEMVTDLDLVRLQIEIAAGAPLPFDILGVGLRGHAIEARVYAEDAHRGFLPSSGILTTFEPPLGAEVRNDVGVLSGDEVSPYYDPILAKMIVYAPSRAQAVSKLRQALRAFRVGGVTTNLDFLQWLSSQEGFINGLTDTGFVDREWHAGTPAEVPHHVLMSAAIFDGLGSGQGGEGGSTSPSAWAAVGGWRHRGLSRSFRYTSSRGEHNVELRPQAAGDWTLVVDEIEHNVRANVLVGGEVTIREGGDTWQTLVTRREDDFEVVHGGSRYILHHAMRNLGTKGRVGPVGGLSTPMPGTVVKVAVVPGQHVDAHQPLVILEAMKMEHAIEAPHAGVVSEVCFAEGDMVPAGAAVVKLDAQ